MRIKRIYNAKSLIYRTTIICIALLSTLISFGQTVTYALTQNDLNSIIYDTPFYDPNQPWCTSSSGTTTVTLTGNDNLQQIFNYLSANGYTTQQAAGITGNIYAESHGDPEIWEGNEKDYQIPPQPDSTNEGWGIAQWTPPSQILDYAQSSGLQAFELSTQVSFLLNQLNGTSPNNNNKAAGDSIKQTTTIDDAAVAFMQDYERPKLDGANSKNAKIRETLAEEVFSLYAASAPAGTGSGGGSSSSSCTNTGGGGTVTGCNFTDTSGTNNDLYTTNTAVIYPNVATVCQRAQLLATGQLINPTTKTPWCSNNSCFEQCDKVAGLSWGYFNSGYKSAYFHWLTMVAGGHAHPGDRNPPVGALLFYKDPFTKGYPANDDGHVVVYLGNNMVISSDIAPNGQFTPGSISIVPAYKIEARGFGDIYLGWSDPIFAGTKDPSF